MGVITLTISSLLSIRNDNIIVQQCQYWKKAIYFQNAIFINNLYLARVGMVFVVACNTIADTALSVDCLSFLRNSDIIALPNTISKYYLLTPLLLLLSFYVYYGIFIVSIVVCHSAVTLVKKITDNNKQQEYQCLCWTDNVLPILVGVIVYHSRPIYFILRSPSHHFI